MKLEFYALGRKQLEWFPQNDILKKPKTAGKSRLLITTILLFYHQSLLHQERIQEYLWGVRGTSNNSRLSHAIRGIDLMINTPFLQESGDRTQREFRIAPDLQYTFDVHKLQKLLEQPLLHHKEILDLYNGPLLSSSNGPEPVWDEIHRLRMQLHSKISSLLVELIRRNNRDKDRHYIDKYLAYLEIIEQIEKKRSGSVSSRLAPLTCDRIVLHVLKDELDDAKEIYHRAKIIYRTESIEWLSAFETYFDGGADRDKWIQWLNNEKRISPFQAPSVVKIYDREPDRDKLTELLFKQNASKIICIEGMAGIGKTTLAANLAYILYHEKGHFEDGVLWASFDTEDIQTVLMTWAFGLGRDLSNVKGNSRLTLFRELLENQNVLLILDNVDFTSTKSNQFITTIRDLKQLFPPFSRSRLLITTRSKDIAQQLSVAHITVNGLPEDASVTMLRERTRINDADYGKLATRVGHHPLALELISKYLKPDVISPDDVLIMLDIDSRDILAHTHIIIGQLVRNLPKKYQVGFIRLAPLRSISFDSEIGRRIIQQTSSKHDWILAKQILIELISINLIEENSKGELRLHPIIADYSHKQFKTHSQSAQIDLIKHYGEMFVLELHHFTKGDITLHEVLEDWGHIINVLDWYQYFQLNAEYVEMVMLVHHVWFALGRYDEALKYLDTLSSMADKSSDLIAWMNLQFGRIFLERSAYDKAREYLNLSMHAYQKLDNIAGMADVFHYQGRLELELTDIRGGEGVDIWDLPEKFFMDSIQIRNNELSPSNEQELARLQSESLLIDIPYHRREFARVINLAGEAIQRLEQMPQSIQRDMLRIRFYAIIGDTEDEQQNYDAALDALEKGINLSMAIGEYTERCRLLFTSSIVSRKLEKYDEAIEYVSEAIQYLTYMQDKDFLCRCLRTRAAAFMKIGAFEQTIIDLNKAIELGIVVNNMRVPDMRIERAAAYLEAGQTKIACDELQAILEERHSLAHLSPYTKDLLQKLIEYCTDQF